MIRLFIFALLLLFSAYSEEIPYGGSIMTIESACGNTIYLSNGTAWTSEFPNLFDGPDGWRQGDRVHISYLFPEGYYLQNASCEGCIPVNLLQAPSREMSTIREIIRNEKKSTNKIVLDDGSTWFIGSWSSTWMQDWEVGDRVIVSEQEFLLGNADHLIINLDETNRGVPENVRAQLWSSLVPIEYEDPNKRECRTWILAIAEMWQEGEARLIQLSNDLVCECFTSNWLIGDQVRFEDLNILMNLRDHQRYEIEIAEASALPFVQEISFDGKSITLSDGSVWFCDDGVFSSWTLSDPVIVTPLDRITFDMSTHSLLNINESCVRATLVK